MNHRNFATVGNNAYVTSQRLRCLRDATDDHFLSLIVDPPSISLQELLPPFALTSLNYLSPARSFFRRTCCFTCNTHARDARRILYHFLYHLQKATFCITFCITYVRFYGNFLLSEWRLIGSIFRLSKCQQIVIVYRLPIRQHNVVKLLQSERCHFKGTNGTNALHPPKWIYYNLWIYYNKCN